MNKTALLWFVLSFFLFKSGLVLGSELFSSAETFGDHSWSLSVYGSDVEAKPRLKISNSDTINIPVSGGNAAVSSDTDSELKVTESYKAAMAVLTVRPRDGFHYKVKVGQVRDFQIEYPSSTVVNSLRAESDGILWGVGVGWNLTQETPVSVGTTVELSYTNLRSSLDRFQSGSLVAGSDVDFFQDEYQGALNFSYRWKQVDPYGGAKLMFKRSQLRDRLAKSRVSGDVSQVSPFVGVKLDAFEGESLVIEASFLDERSVSAGMSVRF